MGLAVPAALYGLGASGAVLQGLGREVRQHPAVFGVDMYVVSDAVVAVAIASALSGDSASQVALAAVAIS